jgi:hypothetical protein
LAGKQVFINNKLITPFLTHGGKVTLTPYEIDKLIPTWGSFVTGLFKYLGCGKTE